MSIESIIKFIEATILSIVAIFAPIQHLISAVAFMITADLVTGVLAARKRGEKITSSGLRRTVVKFFIYELAIMFAFISEHYISNVLPIVKMASAMISTVELKSVYENLNCISGNELLTILIGKLVTPSAIPSSKAPVDDPK